VFLFDLAGRQEPAADRQVVIRRSVFVLLRFALAYSIPIRPYFLLN